MNRLGRTLAIVMMIVSGSSAASQEAVSLLKAQARTVSPLQEDATLRDVVLLGTANGWAVGDQGTILRTGDGGKSWDPVFLGEPLQQYSLHSICFLTDRVGWIAGGTVLPVGGVDQGIILSTRDGGSTWSVLPDRTLPYLRHIQFFDLEQGLAVGERSRRFPTGILRTTDGGQSWQPVTGESVGRWNTAAFITPDTGLIAGERSRRGIVGQGTILPGATTDRGLQAFHDAVLGADGRGCLVGDGAQILVTENQGVSFHLPETPLPKEVADYTDLQSVARHRDLLWTAGFPGSVVWRSDDGGEHWTPAPTGDPTPIHGLSFVSETHGIAVGRLGRISLTTDGGRTWTTVRGRDRRLACLAIHQDAAAAPVTFLTRWSREEGYRAAVLIATRHDIGPDAHMAQRTPLQLEHAVLTAGGNGAEIHWQLPISVPGLELNERKLIDEWTLLTDRRLADVVLGQLVATIRTFRPALVLLDEPKGGDYAAGFLRQAVELAVRHAADPSRFVEQQQLSALRPWQVQKVVMRRSSDSRGEITQAAFELLPRLSRLLGDAAMEAYSRFPDAATRSVQESYTVSSMEEGGNRSRRILLNDLGLTPGGPARRMLPSINPADFEQLTRQLNHRQSITAISRQAANSPDQGSRLLGQINEMLKPLTPEQAAGQLADLGRTYRETANWELAEATYAELITRYPEQPVAIDAMLWLVKFWTSAELNWQRLRTVQSRRSQVAFNDGVARANFEKSLEIAASEPTRTGSEVGLQGLPDSAKMEIRQLPTVIGRINSLYDPNAVVGNQQQMKLVRWQELASAVGGALQGGYPQVHETPELQFVLASLARRRQQPKRADEIYDHYLRTLADDPWHLAARGEAYLIRPGAVSPKPVGRCRQTKTPPVLDGLLSDPCWSEAQEIRLGEEVATETFVGARRQQRTDGTSFGSRPIVMFCHDDKYLYLAASVPIHPDSPADPPKLSGRIHDMDHALLDQLRFQFDVDRDYATWYAFTFDQRGGTSEACWEDRSWNPKYHVAVERDHAAWRLEAAIPKQELLPSEQILGMTWGVGITRVMPGIGSESWTGTGAEQPLPPLFGLLRFD